MHEIKLWVLTSVIAVLVGIVSFIGRYLFTQLFRKLDRIGDLLAGIQTGMASHDEKITALQHGHQDHETRIRTLERHAPPQ